MIQEKYYYVKKYYDDIYQIFMYNLLIKLSFRDDSMFLNQSKKKKILLISLSILLFILIGIVLFIVLNKNQKSENASAYVGSANDLNQDKLVVGAIRYDAWFSPPNYGNEKNLNNSKWHNRLPFYAKINTNGTVEIRGDSQEVVDQEILFAHAGGLDYWAFNYYDRFGLDPRKEKSSVGDLNYGLRYYLNSEYKEKLNFSLNVSGKWTITSKRDWNNVFIPNVVGFMSDSSYQTVLDGRPLLFFYKIDDLSKQMGGEEELKLAIVNLRKESISTGLKDPYIVGLLWGYTRPSEEVLRYGFDAVSNYTASRGNEYNNGILWPYSSLEQSNISFWERLKSEGAQQVPIMNVGWDYRPNIEGDNGLNTIETYGDNPLYETPEPYQIRNHLINTVDWVKKNKQSAKAQAILIYSWAEYPEGGWLNPTLLNGDDRLRAIAYGLGKDYDIEYVEKYKYLEKSSDKVIMFETMKRISKIWENGKPYLYAEWSKEKESDEDFQYYWFAILDENGERQLGKKIDNTNSIKIDFDNFEINKKYSLVIQSIHENGKYYEKKDIIINEDGSLSIQN